MLRRYIFDDDEWDSKALLLVTSALRSPNRDVFAMVLILALLLCVVFVAAVAVDYLVTYLYHAYTAHAYGTSRSARVLQFALIGLVTIWAVAFGLFLTAYTSTGAFVSLLGWSLLVFSLTVTSVEKRQPRTVAARSNVRNYLNWKRS